MPNLTRLAQFPAGRYPKGMLVPESSQDSEPTAAADPPSPTPPPPDDDHDEDGETPSSFSLAGQLMRAYTPFFLAPHHCHHCCLLLLVLFSCLLKQHLRPSSTSTESPGPRWDEDDEPETEAEARRRRRETVEKMSVELADWLLRCNAGEGMSK